MLELDEYIDRRDLIPLDIDRIQDHFDDEQLVVMENIGRHCPGIWQIAVDNPCMAYVLALYTALGGHRRTSVRALLGYRRRDVLFQLGWPGEKWGVRLLAKVYMPGIRISDLLVLRRMCISVKKVELLRHLPVITSDIIQIVSDERLMSFVQFRFLMEASKFCRVRPVCRMLDEVITLAELHGYPLQPFRRISQLTCLHDYLHAMEPPATWLPEFAHMEIPESPISIPRYSQPNNVHLETFFGAKELFRWSKIEHNCAYTLLPEIKYGELYLYKVFKPVRGTLSVRWKNNSWVLGEFLTAWNRPVPRKALLEVAGYLSRRLNKMEVIANE